MLTCHLQLKVKSKTKCPLLMHRLIVTIKHLPLLSNVNVSLVEFIYMLTAFYQLPISLVLPTHSIKDAFKICFSWTKLCNELVCLKETFFGYPEAFINKHFEKLMGIIHEIKETTLTVEKSLLS